MGVWAGCGFGGVFFCLFWDVVGWLGVFFMFRRISDFLEIKQKNV